MKKCPVARVLRVFVLTLILIQMFVTAASANDGILFIYRNNPAESMTFNVSNMFPGDFETSVYNLNVSFDGEISIFFNAKVRPGYEKLAEVLKCKVVLENDDTILYDGLMKNMPDLERKLSGAKAVECLVYKISAYLDTSVGNEYKNTQLIADFKWWAYTASEGYPGIVSPGPMPGITITHPTEDKDKTGIGKDENDGTSTPSEGATTEPGGTTESPEGGNASTGGGTEFPEGGETGAQKPGESPATYENKDVLGENRRPTGELTDPPATGDFANPVLWIVLICISVLVILLILFFGKKKEKEEKDPLVKKLIVCIIIIAILAVCLCTTTFALLYSIISVDGNIFKTGTVEINLNNGQPVITENEFLFEPGMTVRKDFFIENESSDAVYYKIYFDNMSGGLKEVLDVKIFDKETETDLYNGKVSDLIRENCDSAELLLNETRILTAEFHYPLQSGNETKNMSLSFDMCAVATQKRNNINREFN